MKPGSIHFSPGVGRSVSMPFSYLGHLWSSGPMSRGHPRLSGGGSSLPSPGLVPGIIAHSPGGFLFQASHAIPPISLCISVEVLMNIIRSDLTAEVTVGVTASPQLSDNGDRGERIRSYIELHPDVTAADIARSFGITRQTASRHLSKVRVLQGETS